MNPAINSFLRFRPTEDWILQQSGYPWMQLAITVPYAEILAEAQAVYSNSVLHRAQDQVVGYTHQGWRSLTLHGVGSTVTTEQPGNVDWTEVANQCPATKQFVETYWDISTAGRIRFMWLEAGGYILPHVDRQQQRLSECNIAIDHPNEAKLQFLDYGVVPFTTGSAFIIDTSRKHFAVNQSGQLRTHIIVHAKLKSGIVQKSYENSFYC